MPGACFVIIGTGPLDARITELITLRLSRCNLAPLFAHKRMRLPVLGGISSR